MSHKRTIFITSFHPHISRNILSTKAFRILCAEQKLRIVLVVPDYKTAYFRDRFGGPDVIIEGVKPYQASRTFRGLFFKKLGMFLFDSRSARNLKHYQYHVNRKLLQLFAALGLGVLGRFFFIRALARALDYRFSSRGIFAPLLERYRPDLIFSTDVQNENDVTLMQDARRCGVKTIGMVRSWDNLTLRILRIFPDQLCVGSRTLAEEVRRFHQYPFSRVVITGNPHYDLYRGVSRQSKEELCREFGLDPLKKLIVYAPISNALIRKNDADQYILELLGEIRGASILVRFPPEKEVTLNGFVRPPHMVFDQPGFAFQEKEMGDREIRSEDDERLATMLAHADLVITGPTSICLDGIFFDKPVIAVNIYPSPRPFFETAWRYRDNHIQKLLATGGVHYAETKEVFLKTINEYLENPDCDHVGRERARALWFSHADGCAGERLAYFLLGLCGL